MRLHEGEIAQAAARLVVEDGLEYGPAKHQALKALGLPARTPLPGNEEVEDAVLEHIALFCADTQATELLILRQLALRWMQRLAVFRPYLSGCVWHGTATRHSDIHLALFCQDEKEAEIALIDMGVRYQPTSAMGLHARVVPALSILDPCPAMQTRVGIHLRIYDLDDLRGALLPDSKKRSPRGDLAAVSRLLHDAVHEN
jgi:hypothetical protein